LEKENCRAQGIEAQRHEPKVKAKTKKHWMFDLREFTDIASDQM
jgi:hypothetical protein